MRPAFEGDEAGRCGGCGSKSLVRAEGVAAGVGACLECGRLQEIETRDWPESEMCGNCAFRAGSPERSDPYRWREIEETLEAGRFFHCHKGLPLDAKSGEISPPDSAAGRVTVCAGWLAAYAARLRRSERQGGSPKEHDINSEINSETPRETSSEDRGKTVGSAEFSAIKNNPAGVSEFISGAFSGRVSGASS